MVASVNEHQTSLCIERSIEINAPVQVAYDALLEQLGPASQMPDGTSMPMKLEARPGGRWFRDLGDDTGHWWATVQVIKPPKLIELTGPLFMSYPALSHLQYRLVEQGDSTLLEFTHRAIGELDPDHCKGVQTGWDHKMQQIKAAAESAV